MLWPRFCVKKHNVPTAIKLIRRVFGPKIDMVLKGGGLPLKMSVLVIRSLKAHGRGLL